MLKPGDSISFVSTGEGTWVVSIGKGLTTGIVYEVLGFDEAWLVIAIVMSSDECVAFEDAI